MYKTTQKERGGEEKKKNQLQTRDAKLFDINRSKFSQKKYFLLRKTFFKARNSSRCYFLEKNQNNPNSEWSMERNEAKRNLKEKN